MSAKSVLSSRLAAGLWREPDWGFSAPELRDWMAAVLDLGVTTFDLADIYGRYTVEESFGRALALAPELRESMQIVTKCDIKLVHERRPEHRRHVYDTSYGHITRSVENSLGVLGTDRVDVLLLHRQDPLMDPDEVARAFGDLAAAGKVLHFGVSNFTPSHLSMLQSRLGAPLVTNQVEASALELTPFVDGTFDQAIERRMRPMAWSPLGGGRLFSGADAQSLRVRAALESVARETGSTVDRVAFGFLGTHPAGIVPVTGTRSVERIRAALEGLGQPLSREQWFDVWTASNGHGLP